MTSRVTSSTQLRADDVSAQEVIMENVHLQPDAQCNISIEKVEKSSAIFFGILSVIGGVLITLTAMLFGQLGSDSVEPGPIIYSIVVGVILWVSIISLIRSWFLKMICPS